MRNKINIGLVGFGTIGSGTMQLLKQHKKEVEARVGARVEVTDLCDLARKKSPWIGKNVVQTKRWRDLVENPAIDCVIELIGGYHPAKEIVVSALQHGKHVITANKAILSKYYGEIFNTARRVSRLVYFEAAVGGGMPVVQSLNEGLAGNKIQKIVGILNGTTNYILTKMDEEAVGFAEALQSAQEAGFAEADPTFDVEGIDAAQKISILASLAVGQWISPAMVHCEGISKVQSLDARLVKERLNSTIKLMGIAEQLPHGWTLRVHPTLVSKSHPFANVRNEYNAVSLVGDAVEDVLIYGKGAGRLPTASAVLSDLIYLARQINNGTAGLNPYVIHHGAGKLKIGPMSEVKSRYYLRVNTLDQYGVLSRITGILGKNKVSIASVHQDIFEMPMMKKGVPIVLLTHETLERDVQRAVRKIDHLATTIDKTVLLRME